MTFGFIGRRLRSVRLSIDFIVVGDFLKGKTDQAIALFNAAAYDVGQPNARFPPYKQAEITDLMFCANSANRAKALNTARQKLTIIPIRKLSRNFRPVLAPP
jgi:hypothetical protein